jgi:hypothetical protein
MSYPNTFAAQTGPLALSTLDANFNWAIDIQSQAVTAAAGGTADALTATYTPAVTSLINGLILYVRASAANATTTPQFSPNGLTARTIVKATGALAVGDIYGAGHWLQLIYDTTLVAWVLSNPAGTVITNVLDYQVLTTAFAYTFPANTQVLIINPAGALATGTITMPASPSNGMTITVESTQEVTALTLNGNTGQTVIGKPVQLIPNQPLSWIYRASNTTWYPFSGGAGRASALVSGTTVASTSGTSIDFTGIPSWVKRISIMFNGVSTNGTSSIRLQLGISSGISTVGYAGSSGAIAVSSAGGIQTGAAGFDFNDQLTSPATRFGTITLSLFEITSNTWIVFGGYGQGNTPLISIIGGAKGLAGVLDRVRITTVNGTDTFDAGSINISYE